PSGNLVQVIEALRDDYGTEDLLAHDLHVRLDVYDDSGVDVVPPVSGRVSAGRHCGALLASRLQVSENPITLLLRYEGAHLGTLIESGPYHDVSRSIAHALDDSVEDLELYEEARAGHADLAGVEEHRLRGAGGHGLRIHVRQHDDRRLAAELERDALQGGGGGDVDQLADFGRAGERDLVDTRMCNQRGAGRLAEARQDVDDAGWEAGLEDQLAQSQGAERRLFCGLEHAGAAGCEHGRELQRGHEEWEIPRDDLGDGSNRLAHGVGVESGARRGTQGRVEGRAVELARPAGHVAQMRDRARHVDEPRHGYRLAVVQALDLGELCGVPFHQVRQAPHEPLALVRQHLGPGTALECSASCAYGAVYVLGICIGNLRDLTLGRRIHDGDTAPAVRLHPFAIDHQARLALQELADGAGRGGLLGDLVRSGNGVHR